MTNKNDALPVVAGHDQVVGRVYDGKAELNSAGRAMADHSALYSVDVITHRDAKLAELRADRDRLKRMSDNYCALGMDANQELSKLQVELAALREQKPVIEVVHGPLGSDGEPEWVKVVTLGEFDIEHLPNGMQLYAAPLVSDKADHVEVVRQMVSDKAGAVDERANFKAEIVKIWPDCPIQVVRDLLPPSDPHYGDYVDQDIRAAWIGWQARAALNPLTADVAQGGDPAGSFDKHMEYMRRYQDAQKEADTQTARADAAELVLRKIMEAHRFNVAGMSVTEVHSACFDALTAQPVAADVVQVPFELAERLAANALGMTAKKTHWGAVHELRALLATSQGEA